MGELQIKGTDIANAIGMTQGSFSRRYTGSAAWELDELEALQRETTKLGTPITIAYLLGIETDPGEGIPLTGAIVRLEPAPASNDDPKTEQPSPAEYVVLRPTNPVDRSLFTGPIALIAS